ncbi:MAG: 3-oxoacyl-[acyl-carrier-protein] reductase [Bacillota bacterium]|nr:3-oxoacyl-[acyl-carrier-protein] reductase [Bacillota bacterium]
MLSGKTAVVTGAGRGIGRAIAIKLGSLGANVVVNYLRSEEEAQTVAQEIEKAGGRAILVKGDVSDFQEAEKVIKTAVDTFGKLDILVNNAGITKDALLLRMKEEDFDKVINVNLKGAFNCLKHASSFMLKQKSGKIINIASVVGISGNASQVNYSAAKAGIIGMTKSAAKELGARNITVNAVAPGFIETDMTDMLSDKIKDSILNTVPIKRPGKPEDVANAVAFLASEEASYITGHILNVDGGMVM